MAIDSIIEKIHSGHGREKQAWAHTIYQILKDYITLGGAAYQPAATRALNEMNFAQRAAYVSDAIDALKGVHGFENHAVKLAELSPYHDPETMAWYNRKLPEGVLELAGDVAREQGVRIGQLLDGLFANMDQAALMRVSENGKYRVIGVDKFDGSDWLSREFDTAMEAVLYALKKTEEAKEFASDSSIATVYYAYTPDGTYLGGDAWKPGGR